VCRTKIGGHPVHVNEQGYRGLPIAAEKADTRRVLVFGDSATYGWGVRDEETFAMRLGGRLADAGLPVEVVNGGVNAYALFQEEIAFGRALALAPDAAVFAFSFNESWQNLQWLDEAGRERVLRGVRWKNWLRKSAIFHFFGEIQLRFLYDRLRGELTSDLHGGRVRTDDERLVRYRETLARIESRARAANVPVAFLVLPTRGKTTADPYQQAMLDFARERRIPVLDLTGGPEMRPDEWFLPMDTVHPSAAGHADLARRLEPLVRELLARRSARAQHVSAW
jgi:lysophospholipase L1-like esterase